MPNLQIEQTPIHALRPQPQNARTHSKRQIRQIANSIQRFGFCNPILVDDDLTILAGHGRVAAAQAARPHQRANGSAVASQRSRQTRLCDRRQSLGRKSRLGSQPAGH